VWCIRIRKNPHHFGNLDPHPGPHPHQIKIWIRIKICKLDPEPDPDPHQFADVKPKCMEYEPILALFKGFSLFLKLGSDADPHPDPHQIKIRIWIRIRIRVITDKSNPDPHQRDAYSQHWYQY
jgi:hypothetical protein